ncbi:HPr(Ser) kinase/phosphatase [Roseisolibacter sp. H3M3-2]|uniref:HPr(Ser) kinase/phosphatase n=1 Tax=Roseisolibacter sp. H3M3-2 TaxID=3031323 RepID=UPI0023DC694D|nr:HPr(Ser) kinase/phosphatase [Roseisolibacter sp. H3M3-2]MDF1503341.1 HPr(Ser) kinase/phosphatase [Roseisolibacter sp. H3M3-2]
MKPRLTVRQLVDRLGTSVPLEQIGDPVGLDRQVTSPEAASPGLVLSGYFNRFPHERIQVFGETEVTYLNSREPDVRRATLEAFFSHPIPCAFITKGQEPPAGFLELAGRGGVPVLRTPIKTAEFYRLIKPFLAEEFAPTATLHGSLADVFGVGLFFTGPSGIGKSECVLDLVERGHRLVADDLVIVKRRGNDVLIGKGHELQRHYMEIRGIGLIDIPAIFGIRAVRQQKRLEVVVHLEEWNQDAVVDRTGLDGETHTILDVELPKIRVPLNPGKNITVIAEVIAMNHLLRYSGVNPAEAFNQRLMARMRGDGGPPPAGASVAQADLRRYLQEDDE